MVGVSLLLVVFLFAVWTIYRIAGFFPPLRNRTCRIVSMLCPILMLSVVCYRPRGSFGIVIWPVQWFFEAKGKELAGMLLAAWTIFTLPTIILTTVVGSVRLSLLGQGHPEKTEDFDGPSS